ncbi:MAG: beta strand repeat-containing protein [Oscillospiraceae bacterium]
MSVDRALSYWTFRTARWKTPANGYAVYFAATGVTAANLNTYYTKTGGTVGRVYPTAVELLGNDDAFKGSYVTLDEAIGAAATGDKLKVIADINLGETGVDINGIALTLDLNGHKITHSGSTAGNMDAINLVNSTGTALTVMDSSTGQTGKLEAVKIAINNVSSGTVTITGGTVLSTGANGTAISGGSNSGEIKVTGGTVTASGLNAAIASGSAITVESGTVSSTGLRILKPSCNGTNGTVTVSGGTVSATNGGTAIYKDDSQGKVTISGSATVTSGNKTSGSGTIRLGPVQSSSSAPALEIKENATVKNTAGGNAVYNGFAGVIAVSGGTVETTSGKAIDNASTGKVTISGTATVTSANTNANEGTIRFNTTTDSTAVVLEITGGTVKNTAGGNAIYNYSTGKINVSGGTVEATTGNAIYNDTTGAVNVSGGTVKATGDSGVAIYNNSTGEVIVNPGTVNVSGGTVSATTGNAIFNGGALTVTNGTVQATGDKGRAIVGAGAVNVSGGTVSATSGYAISSMGAVTVSGGKVESTSSCAIYNNSAFSDSIGKITISNNAVVTSANADSTSGTFTSTQCRWRTDPSLDIGNTAG